MGEAPRHSGWLSCQRHEITFQNLANHRVEIAFGSDPMVIDVKFQVHLAESELAHLNHSRLEVAGPEHFLEEFFRNRLTGLVVLGKKVEADA